MPYLYTQAKESFVQRLFQIDCTILFSQAACWREAKPNFARNGVCVQYGETIKTTMCNEGNRSLMKRLRRSIADPLRPAHEKRRIRQNAYKAPSQPLWSGVRKTRHLAWSPHFHFDNPQILTLKSTVCSLAAFLLFHCLQHSWLCS